MIPEYLDIPIFPLPNVTLFPKTLLPLHVFEPRYRKMIEGCVNGDRMLGIALLREGWQKDYFGQPPIHKTLGVGKIVDHVELENGCSDVIVEGLYRSHLVTEYPTTPYRTARVSILMDGPIDHLRSEVAGVQKELVEECRELGEMMPEFREMIQSVLAAHPHPSVTADLLATSLVIDAYDRQSILECPDPIRRMRLVLVQVRRIMFQLTKKEVEE